MRRTRSIRLIALSLLIVAPLTASSGCAGGTTPPLPAQPAAVGKPAPPPRPLTLPCRLVSIDEARVREAITRAAERLAGCRGVDTTFAKHIYINPTSSAGLSPKGLVVEIVRDAVPSQVRAGCIDEAHTAELRVKKDALSVEGICVSEGATLSSPARVRCSAGAIERILKQSTTELWDIPLVYVFAHELAHIARKHVGGAFLPAPAEVVLNLSPRDRAGSIASFCNDLPATQKGRQHEIEADDDALWVLRIELDDVSAAGPGCAVPPARGGTGEIPSSDMIGAPGEGPPERTPRGRLGSAEALTMQFHALSEDLAAWEMRFAPVALTSKILTEPPLQAPDGLMFDRTAGELLCEVLNAPVTKKRFLLPTLPGVSHPDGYLRLARVSRAIDRIATPSAGLVAVIDRQVAAYSTGIVDPFCRKAKDAQVELPTMPGAVVACQALLAPPPPELLCKPFSADLTDIPFSASPTGLKAKVTAKGAASLIELDVSVWSAASLGKRGILVGKGDVFGTTSAIGLLPHGATTATLSEIPCTATSIAASEDRAVAFCREPLAVVPLSAEGKPQSVRRLQRVILDGAQVDGYIKGLLDNHGQLVDQSMYKQPMVHGQLDRHGVALMRQARFNWSGVVDGRILAALDFPAGGSETVEEHSSLGVTLEYAEGRLSPLPLWRTSTSCTSITDSIVIGSKGSRWFGALPLSPVEVVELDAKGSQVLAHYKPRSLPSGELSDTDVTQCAFSPLHGKFTCVDENGAIFEPSASGGRTALGAFPLSTSEQTVAMCGTLKRLTLLVKKRVKFGDEFALYTIVKDQVRGALVHREEFDRGGLSCSSAGVVAFFSSTQRGFMIHLPD